MCSNVWRKQLFRSILTCFPWFQGEVADVGLQFQARDHVRHPAGRPLHPLLQREEDQDDLRWREEVPRSLKVDEKWMKSGSERGQKHAKRMKTRPFRAERALEPWLHEAPGAAEALRQLRHRRDPTAAGLQAYRDARQGFRYPYSSIYSSLILLIVIHIS